MLAGAVLSTGAFAIALATPANAAVIEQASWDVSNNQTATVGTTYTYQATVVSAAIIGSITIALPDAPALPPTLGPIFGIGAGSLTTSNNMLVYTVQKPVIVPAGTILYLQFSGITNTTRQGWFSSIITTISAGPKPIIVDAGQTSNVAFLTHNNTPDFTSMRALSVAAEGGNLTIASPLQGYSVRIDTSEQLSPAASSVVGPVSSPVASPVASPLFVFTPRATGTQPNVLSLGLPATAPSRATASALHLTVWPAY
jgi:hypothetical protein